MLKFFEFIFVNLNTDITNGELVKIYSSVLLIIDVKINQLKIFRMKTKVLFLLAIAFMLSLCVNAQRGVRIGYIDTEYILENVPEYQEATSQLDSKVQKWKVEIEKKLNRN